MTYNTKINDKYILDLFLDKNNQVISKLCRNTGLNKHIEIKEYLENRFDYFNGIYGDVIKLIRDKFKEWPKCENCNEFITKHPDYHKFCSTKCAANSEKTKKKRKQACLDHFGVEYPLQSKMIQEKTRQTCLDHFGTESPAQSDQVKNKMRQTCLKNYGVFSYSKTSEFLEKIKQTNLNNLGVEFPLQNEEVKEKTKQTYLEHFGVDHSSKNKEIREKIKNSNKQTYQNTSEIIKKDRIERMKNTYQSKSIEEKENINKKHSDTCKNRTQEEKQNVSKNISEGLKNIPKEVKDEIIKRQIKSNKKTWNNKSKEEKQIIKDKRKQTWFNKTEEEKKKAKDKEIETKKKNGTLNSSYQEDKIYYELCKKFVKSDIEREYSKDKRYPFHCDFYIKSLDLFIECNFHWSHGEHWFNKNSEKDQKTLQKWKSKAKNSDFYKNAIETWTKRDIEKRKIAKNSDINYVVFWNEKDFEVWVSLNFPKKFQN